jgi:hypothetical protein
MIAFDLLIKLMNKMVVNFSSGSIYTSARALEGYCYFHR